MMRRCAEVFESSTAKWRNWFSSCHSVEVEKSKSGKNNFKKNFFEDISPFCGAIDTPVFDFWSRLPWVSKQGRSMCLHVSSTTCNRILRFTSGATPAELLAASIATEPFSSRYLRISLGSIRKNYFCTVRVWRKNTLISGGPRNFLKGCANLLFCNFLLKTVWKWKNLDPGGQWYFT